MSKLHISYNQIHKLISATVDKYQFVENFKPDLIVAIGGGGFIPARILRTFLKSASDRKNIPIQAIGLNLYEELPTHQDSDEEGVPEKPGQVVQKTQWLNFGGSDSLVSLLGRRILIVDEVDDTRKTLAYAVDELRKDIIKQEELRGMKPGESNTQIGIFVIHNKNKEKLGVLPEDVMAHYYPAANMDDVWLVYPWDAIDIDTHTEKAENKQ
ncbi:hypoxanthine-guanine phosphoribosyltransferase [Mycoemilia scoparia]|uniref:Hypoxanthine-guanine phosphoribosyltransferase n=1 Tax=Mycoemilia scoparia TaxID=417184 RepID=A0A9W8A3F7_9FUNG|nr:hypoxanthine-guanine phosphoribosyltransferase [Mycoemilia scoparia]